MKNDDLNIQMQNRAGKTKKMIKTNFASMSIALIIMIIVAVFGTSSVWVLAAFIILTLAICAVGLMSVKTVSSTIDVLVESAHELPETTNVIVDEPVKIDVSDISACLVAYAKGNFSGQFEAFSDNSINEALTELKRNTLAFKQDVDALSKSVQSGELSSRLNTSNYDGSWADLAVAVNLIVDEFMLPIKDVSAFFKEMSTGNMNSVLTYSYRGDFKALKTDIEAYLSRDGAYVSELIRVLSEMGNKNFDAEVKMEFEGDYKPIKVSVNSAAAAVNEILSEVYNAAGNMYGDVSSIASSSRTLEEGAIEQGTEIDILLKNLEEIGNHAYENSQSAATANELTQKTQEKAILGGAELKQMQKAIEEVNEAAGSISKVIKVIDDIAFQTNLLALNAAVEAARAGQHGKGFAVVAEEVRNLANRSQNAAKETGILIAGSAQKAAEGTKIANQTASTLSEIIEQVVEISTLINGVAESSEGQETAVKQISEGVEKISAIARSNSLVAENAASSAESLNSQTEMFKSMISSVKIKKIPGKTVRLENNMPIGKPISAPKATPKEPPKAKPKAVNIPKSKPTEKLTAPKMSVPVKKENFKPALPKADARPAPEPKISGSDNSHEALLKEIHANLDAPPAEDMPIDSVPKAAQAAPVAKPPSARPIVPNPIAQKPSAPKSSVPKSSDNLGDNTGIKGSKVTAPDFSHIYDKNDFGKF